MVVVVSRAGFVSGCVAGGLHAIEQTTFGKKAEHIINRLAGNDTNLLFDILNNLISGAVRTVTNRLHDRNALGSHSDTIATQQFKFGHAIYFVEMWTQSSFQNRKKMHKKTGTQAGSGLIDWRVS